MKVVFASRTGNVESIVNKLGVDDLMKIEMVMKKSMKTISYSLILMAMVMCQWRLMTFYQAMQNI